MESKKDLSESQQLIEQFCAEIAQAKKVIEESHSLIEESHRLLDKGRVF
jgi:hypothetical protein